MTSMRLRQHLTRPMTRPRSLSFRRRSCTSTPGPQMGVSDIINGQNDRDSFGSSYPWQTTCHVKSRRVAEPPRSHPALKTYGTKAERKGYLDRGL